MGMDYLTDPSVGLKELRQRREEVRAALGPVNHTQNPELIEFRDWLNHRGRIKLGDLVTLHRNGRSEGVLGRVVVMAGDEKSCRVVWGVKRLSYDERTDGNHAHPVSWYDIEDLLTIKRPRSIKDGFIDNEWALIKSR